MDTLAGAQGRSTTLDALTSRAPAPMPRTVRSTEPLTAEMPRPGGAETGTSPLSHSSRSLWRGPRWRPRRPGQADIMGGAAASLAPKEAVDRWLLVGDDAGTGSGGAQP